jgi:hypothetical protein
MVAPPPSSTSAAWGLAVRGVPDLANEVGLARQRVAHGQLVAAEDAIDDLVRVSVRARAPDQTWNVRLWRRGVYARALADWTNVLLDTLGVAAHRAGAQPAIEERDPSKKWCRTETIS